MNNIIDIELLKNMPITDDFLDILGFPLYERPNSKRKDLSVMIESEKIIYSGSFVHLEIHSDGRMFCYMLSTMGKQLYPVLNAFQIVRYIDSYLNSLK